VSEPPEANSLLQSGIGHLHAKQFKQALKLIQEAHELFKSTGKKREQGIASRYIGQTLYALKQNKEALVSATQAIRLLREVDEQEELQKALVIMGRILETLGYIEESSRAFEQAAEIRLPDQDIVYRINLLIEVGQNLRKANHLQRSAKHLSEAVELARGIQNAEKLAEVLGVYTRVLQQQKEYDKAIRIFQELVQVSDKLGDSLLSAHARLGLISPLLAQNRLEEANKLISQIEANTTLLSEPTVRSMIQYHKARILQKKNQLREALPFAEEAHKIFETNDDSQALAQSSLLLAQIHEQLADEVKSQRFYDKAIELFEKTEEYQALLQTRISKGKALLQFGRKNLAEKEFAHVIRHYKEKNQPAQEAAIYLEIATILSHQKKFAETREQIFLALDVLKDLELEEQELLAFQLLLKASKASDHIDEDLPYLQEAIDRAKKQQKEKLHSYLSVGYAQHTFQTKPVEESIKIFEQALANFELPSQLRTELIIPLSELYLKKSQFKEAIQCLNKALSDFESEPTLDKATIYKQLAKGYQGLGKPQERKVALESALEELTETTEQVVRGRIFLDLAPILAKEQPDQAIEYYQKAIAIFEKWEYPHQLFSALIGGATLLGIKKDAKAVVLAEKALRIAEELMISIDIETGIDLNFAPLIRAVEVGIFAATQRYSKQKDKAMIEKIFDWSHRRKAAKIHSYLANNLGFERCPELSKLMQEEENLIKQTVTIRQELANLSRSESAFKEFQNQRDALRKQLAEVLSAINVNRNVIAAACADPGRNLPPPDYKTLQKISTLMPPDRRWILINYDVLAKEKRIIVTTMDYVGRHGNHTLPISQDLTSIINQLRIIKKTETLPASTQLQDVGRLLFSNLIPNLLVRQMDTNTYGYLQIISDDFINHVPFELFHDGQTFWGLKYPIAWAPDLQFFESTLKIKALAQQTTPSVVLGVNSTPQEKATRKDIAEDIAKSFLGSVPTTPKVSEPIVLFGRDFTRTLMSSSCDHPRSLIYLSTPTKIHYQKGEIALTHPDSYRAIEIGVTTNFKGAPILILDEATQVDPSEDGLGLAAFLRRLVTAGGTSIIFTRWLPNPKMQSHFASEVVRRLYEGDPIAVVMLHVRRKLQALVPTPQSWIPYSLVGNPFPTLL
jgi:tetratricopeptide (TPR) repeat protein